MIYYVKKVRFSLDGSIHNVEINPTVGPINHIRTFPNLFRKDMIYIYIPATAAEYEAFVKQQKNIELSYCRYDGIRYFDHDIIKTDYNNGMEDYDVIRVLHPNRHQRKHLNAIAAIADKYGLALKQ